jgi:DNA-directed RNA polymerase
VLAFRGSLAAVHDSYGTVAADVAMLAEELREEFVRMYEEHDVLAELRATQPEELLWSSG